MPPGLDPLVHQPTRLLILALLYRNRQASFRSVVDALDLTAGNVASHVEKLEAAGLVESRRALTGAAFEVRFRITPAGDAAFRAHLEALERLIREAKGSGPQADSAPQKSDG